MINKNICALTTKKKKELKRRYRRYKSFWGLIKGLEYKTI